MRFTDLDLDPALLRGVTDMGFAEPTPIQSGALPPALAGNDVLATAMTGSGKTAAFVLPILQQLHVSGYRRGLRALVLTPTRELAAQVHEHLQDLGRYLRISATTVFGGVKPAPQVRALRAGVNVVVATPGRLLDHMREPWFSCDSLQILVLDEADRMLDMGFLPDIRRILARLPERRQTMLFSATMPAPIAELSRSLLRQPVRLGVERKASPATGVEQSVLAVAETDKRFLLLEMLRRNEVRTALVFTRTKHRANRLANFLGGAGITCDRIHGNRSQPQRGAALAAFKHGRIRVLVATDIAARGIDVEALPHVINFDVPRQAEDYVHRVGRTARAGMTGCALTFVSPAEEGELRAIERAVGRRLHRRHLDGFDLTDVPAAATVRQPVPVSRNCPHPPSKQPKLVQGHTRGRGSGKPGNRPGGRREGAAGLAGRRSENRSRSRKARRVAGSESQAEPAGSAV